MRNKGNVPSQKRRHHKRWMRRHGEARNTTRNKRSQVAATMRYQRWSEHDDALLELGLKEWQLVKQLGRSIRAIQMRKAKLRNNL